MKIKLFVTRYFIVIILLALILLHAIFIKINQWHLPKSLAHKTILIQGVISSIPEKKYYGDHFQFETQKINHKIIHTTLLINWYHWPPKLSAGQQWKLHVRLQVPKNFHHSNGFDYAKYLLSQGIAATGYVVFRHDKNKLIGKNSAYFLDHFRENVEKQIFDAIKNPTIAAFISALSVGLRDGLTESDWQVFQKTGTNHLVAIAGLHIGFVFTVIYFFSLFSIKFFPKLLLMIPASHAAKIISVIGALSYAALSGFAIPAQRASIMLICFIAGALCYRKIAITKRLLFSALIILLINPLNIESMSFWLSFSSIALLAWVMSARLRASNHIISWGKMQGALTIGLLPLMLYFFQQASLIAFVTNVVAIPWIGFFILPLSLIATILFSLHFYKLSHHLFFLCGKCLFPLWQFLQDASRTTFAVWHHPIFNPLILVIAMIASIFLLAPRGFPARFLGCFGLLPLFFVIHHF
ncbi:MAG: hypothetical protein A3E81_00965 [Gammaproteobacteria bacterium RIFCSPHIGHO2_12_FULL_36_30]|nr:MAG: hypothetical protein A3E81_00965 [Gammaproteobacteria bacterium RIFCSPHIGHO2_12_FULL_36_30]